MAGVVTLVFKRIGQPVVLGYLLAGFLVGPEISFLPTIQEREAIKIWAEIGVIVLLFGLGLEFSFKKLASVGRGATVTAVTEIVSMFGLGYLVGRIFGWGTMDSVFLGGILSISSTTIIIRAIDELGMKQRGFVSLVFGVLIVEDLVAVLLMVLLSTIAVSHSFEGLQLLTSAARLAFFLSLWFLAGIFIVPWFLRRIRPLMNSENYLIASLGLCFVMVVVATHSGFSPALGAFIMGSILAETPDGEKIEHGLKPVRDLFAAIFFVSVGMLIEVKTLQEHWLVVVVLSVITILGKLVSTSLGALLAGQSLRHSVQAGMSLAQIGEFSFIIATLGLTLKVTSDFLYPIAVAVSAITTFTTPYMIRIADPTYSWIDQRLPQAWRERLAGIAEAPGQKMLGDRHISYLRVFFSSILVIAIALSSSQWLYPWLESHFDSEPMARLVTLMVALFASFPFHWAILSRPSNLGARPFTQTDLRNLTRQALLSWLGRVGLSIFLLAFVVSQFTSAVGGFLVVSGLAIFTGWIGYRNFAGIYQWLESQFIKHLNEKERQAVATEKPKLAPWDAHLAEIEVHPDSTVVGQTLAELALRESVGVTVALIERGSRRILAPGRDTVFMAFDRVYVIGTDDQLARLSNLLEADRRAGETKDVNYGLDTLTLSSGSPFIGRTIRDSGIREATDGLIVGVERNGQRILNPDSLLTLQLDDLLWIVGDRERIQQAPISQS